MIYLSVDYAISRESRSPPQCGLVSMPERALGEIQMNRDPDKKPK